MSSRDTTSEAPPTRTTLRERLRRQEEEIRSLCGELLDRYEEATFVYRLGERIGSVLGERAIARVVLEEAGRVLGAREGEVWLRDGESWCLAATVPDLGRVGGLDGDPAIRRIRERGREWSLEGATGDAAEAAVPLPGEADVPLGALVFRGRSPGRAYRSGEFKLLHAIASLASAFIRNDRLAEKARQADARKRENEIARQVHRGLLPRSDPSFPGLSIAGGFRAAEVVGGDYYGYVPLVDGGLGLAMADVSGHGVGAALYMATAKGAIQSEARGVRSPAEILSRVNGVLASDFAVTDMFATAVFIRFAPGGRRLAYANAGHNPPLLLRADGRTERLDRSGPALGVMPSVGYSEQELPFEPGDVLLVYTDGVVEARDRDRGLYGTDRLAAVARAGFETDAARIHASVFEDVGRHADHAPPRDDITLVVVKATPGRDSQREGA